MGCKANECLARIYDRFVSLVFLVTEKTVYFPYQISIACKAAR